MSTTPELDVHVSAPGEIDGEVRRYAVAKIAAVAGHTAEPVLAAEVRLRLERNPALERPAVAEATLDLNGRPVRAHVAAGSPTEAIDLLEARLLRRLERHRAHTEGHAHRGSTSTDTSWRHGDTTHRPAVLSRPVEERDVVRLKTFALDPMTLDEAAFDLDLLGHDFYLFTEVGSGVDGVLVHAADGAYEWHPVDGSVALPSPLAAAVHRHATGAPTLSVEEALERLDNGGEAWVLFVDAENGRGAVAYRRYDGHYGLITAA